MINFRFHLASLVAIFLALALGVVIGAGVIDRGVVDALDSRLNRVEAKSDRTSAANDALKAQLTEQDEALGGLSTKAVDGALAATNVGIIAVRGVDTDRVNQTVASLQAGGAHVTGVLWLEQPWTLDTDAQVTELARAIGSSSRRPAQVRNEAWTQIAARLSTPVPSASTDDVLTSLSDAKFVSFDASSGSGTLAQFPGAAAGIVLIVGSDGDVPASDVVIPASTALTRDLVPLVAADVYDAEAPHVDARGSVFDPLRATELSTEVSTVDDLDRPVGPPTVTLALADLFLAPPVVGHYGLGADRVLLPERPSS
jgi:hypothetical protein